MSKQIKEQLIKLGSDHPELQDDIRPVLDELSREKTAAPMADGAEVSLTFVDDPEGIPALTDGELVSHPNFGMTPFGLDVDPSYTSGYLVQDIKELFQENRALLEEGRF